MAGDNENEKAALIELKKRMEGGMEIEMYEDDNLLYRFLRARDFKVDDAELMLREHLEWRKKYDVKNISKHKHPEVLEKHFLLVMLGHDKDGCIVKYNHFGNTDLRGIFESCKIEDWYKYLIHFFEEDVVESKRQSEKLGKTIEKVVYIENAENFSLRKATDRKVISLMISSIIMYLNNYPETLKTAYVINSPFYFNLFFSMMKPFLPSIVVQKIKIYSDDSWRKDLLEVVDAEVLPAFLGGKRTDPDGNPLCLTLLKNTLPVPKTYYISAHKRSFTTLPGVQKVTVSRAAVHEISLEVKEPDSHLEWEFQLKSGEIKFGIVFKDQKGKKTEVIPLQKLNTDDNAESGIYKCENTGLYIAVFDNSYSFLKSKEVYYKIKVKNLHEETCDLTSICGS